MSERGYWIDPDGKVLFGGLRADFENSTSPRKIAARATAIFKPFAETGERPEDYKWNDIANRWVPDPDLVSNREQRGRRAVAEQVYLDEQMAIRAAEPDAPQELKDWLAHRRP